MAAAGAGGRHVEMGNVAHFYVTGVPAKPAKVAIMGPAGCSWL